MVRLKELVTLDDNFNITGGPAQYQTLTQTQCCWLEVTTPLPLYPGMARRGGKRTSAQDSILHAIIMGVPVFFPRTMRGYRFISILIKEWYLYYFRCCWSLGAQSAPSSVTRLRCIAHLLESGGRSLVVLCQDQWRECVWWLSTTKSFSLVRGSFN